MVFLQIKQSSHLSKFLLLGTVAHTFSLLASSFVEEEHQTWYFFSLTALLTITVRVLGIWLTSLAGRTKHIHNIEKDRLEGQYDAIPGRYGEDGGFPVKKLAWENIKPKSIDDNDDAWRGSGYDVVRLCAVMVLTRMARSWNRTGDKWAHLPDVGDWLVR